MCNAHESLIRYDFIFYLKKTIFSLLFCILIWNLKIMIVINTHFFYYYVCVWNIKYKFNNNGSY